ncbi:uncharacterized protein F4822DRAFT_432501 [Hypoxylon trugodes]|uniref:uncharacterized protein n=1 Tax=Hypoxylon trugodes TaxID=326681 RepID=UPI002194BBDE|nr:uncharacterized protein F4822DRAFT_432501 [Hypoxylon trugodes]KAI1385647.1 hypothetical protein F4822DRAFT_432501 [Hypoxylon trugodes]
MQYKTLVFALLGFTGIASSMVIGDRSTSLATPEIEARTPPSIIAIADEVDEADEQDA